MRLDKLVGKACYELNVTVYDWETNTRILIIQYGDFSKYEDYMKNFKVRSISVDHYNSLVVYVSKKGRIYYGYVRKLAQYRVWKRYEYKRGSDVLGQLFCN